MFIEADIVYHSEKKNITGDIGSLACRGPTFKGGHRLYLSICGLLRTYLGVCLVFLSTECCRWAYLEPPKDPLDGFTPPKSFRLISVQRAWVLQLPQTGRKLHFRSYVHFRDPNG